MMKKLLKIFFINILILLILLLTAEIATYIVADLLYVKNAKLYKLPIEESELFYKFNIKTFDEYYYAEIKNENKIPVGLKYKKPPIVIFGCSYAYGTRLKDDQNFGYKLSTLTKRPVYNYSVVGGGIQHMLYLLRNPEFYKYTPEPECIVFVFVPSLHIDRLYKYSFYLWSKTLYLRYKYSNNSLVQVKEFPKIIRSLYIVKAFYNFKNRRIIEGEYSRENIEFASEHFIESQQEIKKHWKNTKLIVLYYNQELDNQEILSANKISKSILKEHGIITVDINDLSKENFAKKQYTLSEYDLHPNSKAWDVIVPKFVKTLNL